MWAMKIKIREKWNPYNERCKKFKVNISFYSLNNYKKDGYVYVVGAGVVSGDEKSKNSFFKSLEKDKKIVKIGRNEDFFIGIYRETLDNAKKRGVDLAYNPSLVHLKPIIFDEEGWEEWEFASMEREIFEKILSSSRIEKNEIESKIFYFKNKKIKTIMPFTMFPQLTEKQKSAVILAYKNGYYESPRKTSLVELSKIAKLSLSTFQVHLRKAEKKLFPFILKKYSEKQ